MTRAVSLALALTLSSAPVANIVCAEWCDAGSSVGGSASDVCRSEMGRSLFGVHASDACAAFATAPFIREDARRVAPETTSLDVAFLPPALSVLGWSVRSGVSEGTHRLLPNHAQMLVLRI